MAVRLAYILTKLTTHFNLEVDSHGDGVKDNIFLPPNTVFLREGPNLRIKSPEGTSLAVKFGVGNDGDTETFNDTTNINEAMNNLAGIL